METIALGISGATGRMGRRLIALAAEQPQLFRLAAALDAPASADLGKDAGELAGLKPLGLPLASALGQSPLPGQSPLDVLIDFSVPAATRALIPQCASQGIALLIGTTGLGVADEQLINQAAARIPVLQATNTSLGVNILLSVAADMARQLGEAYDIEIVEAHHSLKKDAPSGTALSLAQSICQATGRDARHDLVHGRHGNDALRKKGTIGMHAVRMGDVVGEHTVYFSTPGERIEIRHVATTRDTFVRGALRAAAFLADMKRQNKPGRYTMASVLGL